MLFKDRTLKLSSSVILWRIYLSREFHLVFVILVLRMTKGQFFACAVRLYFISLKIFFIFIYFIYVHECFWNMYVSAQCMCVASEAKRVHQISWDMLMNICKPPCAFWELNLSRLNEQQMLWVYELSLQVHIFLSLSLRYHSIYQIFMAA